MSERNPQIDPKPGDVLLGEGGIRLVSTKPSRVVLEGLVWYKTPTHNDCNAYPDSWHHWAKGAEVLHVAD